MEAPKRRDRIGRLVHGAEKELVEVRVLIVGVGGIGCEILKVLAKMNIGAIHILDMDTIEITNLNRQFLFKTCHKGMSKALVAQQTILKLNPGLNIQAHHTNIKDLDMSFFKQFDFLIMALDNIDARNYVNRIGIRLGVPIIDAGTLAYKGNVTTIISQTSRCYSCEPKSSSQKVYPVCTIRSRPQQPIHCIVWAKMLFEVMFGGNTDNDMNDLAALASQEPQAILTQLFQKDIEHIRNSKQDSEHNQLTEAYLKRIIPLRTEIISANCNSQILGNFNGFQESQPLEANISIFAQSFHRLREQKNELGCVVFEKDEDDIIHFVSSAANLRMFCFTIDQQSFNDVKNMAGNIVPAIASTNSIVSGIQVIEMIKYIRGKKDKLKTYFIQNQHNKIFPLKLDAPLPNCQICSIEAIPVTIQADFKTCRLKDLISIIEERSPTLAEFSLNQGSKEIYNSDEPRETLLAKTMFELSESFEFDLFLTDEETMSNVCTIWMIHQANANGMTVTHDEKLIPKPKVETIQAEEPVQGNNDENSDVVIFGDEASAQLQIIEVHKREMPQSTDLSVYDELKKKKKLDQ